MMEATATLPLLTAEEVAAYLAAKRLSHPGGTI